MTDLLTRPATAGPSDDLDDVRSIFAYGTLRPGHGNHDWTVGHLRPRTRPGIVDNVSIVAPLPSFPYALDAVGEETFGDLLTFDDEDWPEALASCDRLEGYPHHYDRRVVDALSGLDRIRAWLYIAPADRQADLRRRFPPVPGNDYTAALGRLTR